MPPRAVFIAPTIERARQLAEAWGFAPDEVRLICEPLVTRGYSRNFPIYVDEDVAVWEKWAAVLAPYTNVIYGYPA